MGNIGWPQLLIVLVIVLLLFGAKRLRTIGSDLGAAVKGFKNSVREGEAEANSAKLEQQSDEPLEGEAASKDKKEV